VFSSRWNRTNHRYRPWQTDRSFNRWNSVDICLCVGTIPHHLWDHWLLCGWLSGTIIHHCWDHRSLVLFCFFANLSVDIDRWPIFFRRSISTVDQCFFVWIDLDGRYQLIFFRVGYYQLNRPLISTVILPKCNQTDRRYQPCSPVGAFEPTVEIDCDWPTGHLNQPT